MTLGAKGKYAAASRHHQRLKAIFGPKQRPMSGVGNFSMQKIVGQRIKCIALIRNLCVILGLIWRRGKQTRRMTI